MTMQLILNIIRLSLDLVGDHVVCNIMQKALCGGGNWVKQSRAKDLLLVRRRTGIIPKLFVDMAGPVIGCVAMFLRSR